MFGLKSLHLLFPAAVLLWPSFFTALAAEKLPEPGPICRKLWMTEVHDISGFVQAQIKHKPAPRYPTNALNDWSEGWVLLEYAISPEGVPQGMTVVDAVGPKDFVDMSVKTVGRWRYTPATRNGKPVEQSLYQASVTFLLTGSTRAADHRGFISKYKEAHKFLLEDDADNTIATMEQAFKMRLNLYEEARGSLLLALAYAKKQDWPHALYHTRHALIENGAYLEKALHISARGLQVELEMRDGSYAESLCAFETLRAIDPPSAADGTISAKIAAQVDAALANPAPLGVPARLAAHPLFEAPAVWRHRLLRKKFYFSDIKGEVKSFRLACIGTAHEAPVDMEMVWNVPSAAGQCILRVDGAPGATFTLVEEW